MTAHSLKTSAKTVLLKPAQFINQRFLYVARVDMACSRGALSIATRRFDATKTQTWEFSAFSQNGEDGIVDHLLSLVREPNRYFVEIGASDGLENNSSFLAVVKKYDGLMVEADEFLSRNARRFLGPFNWSVRYLPLLVTPESVPSLAEHSLYRDPDFFSLDIDGNDYYIALRCLEVGFRPCVVCVEYNSAFGPAQPVTIPYTPGFDYQTAHPSRLYYGVSLAAWQALFESYGYRFVTVDSRGVNAFFVRPDAVDTRSFESLENLRFEENRAQLIRTGQRWQEQFAQISAMPYRTVA